MKLTDENGNTYEFEMVNSMSGNIGYLKPLDSFPKGLPSKFPPGFIGYSGKDYSKEHAEKIGETQAKINEIIEYLKAWQSLERSK